MKVAFRLAIMALCLSLASGCVGPHGPGSRPETLDSIEAELHQDVAILASDEFEGRRPGTAGERKTLDYLADKWTAIGLESGTNDPANPWYAPVELTVRSPKSAKVEFRRGSYKIPIAEGRVRLFTSGQRALLADAPLLFVGKRGAELSKSELTGRIAVMMWDHPAREQQRLALFENGAAAVIAIVSDPAELEQLVHIRERGAYRLSGRDDEAEIDGFINQETAETIFGHGRLATMMRDAEMINFKPQMLGVKVDMELVTATSGMRTYNLIGKLKGANSDGKSVVLIAHWDHFGICGESDSGDLICNGAVDNASGVAVLNAAAKRLSAGPKLDRDVYFVASTAEEWGLLGAIAFTRNPPVPLGSISAAFNIDTAGVAQRGGPVVIVGRGLTTLDTQLDKIIHQAGRIIAEQDEFSPRFVQRQDGWALLQRGVPAVMVSSAFARPELIEKYINERYHRPSDDSSQIELGGAAEDVLLHIALVRHFATRPAPEIPPKK